MKTKATLLGTVVLLVGTSLFFTSWTVKNTTSKRGSTWVAPVSANKIVNPLKGDATAVTEGAKIFKQMCVVCHGKKGKGDGIAGGSLHPKPANFTHENIQSETDGALYWKLTNGRPPMAAYKESLKDEQRWQLVNYIRTFKKK